MRILFVLFPLLGAALTGCGVIRSMEWNRQAIDMSTAVIYENVQAIEEANRGIEENRRKLEEINKTLQNMGE